MATDRRRIPCYLTDDEASDLEQMAAQDGRSLSSELGHLVRQAARERRMMASVSASGIPAGSMESGS